MKILRSYWRSLSAAALTLVMLSLSSIASAHLLPAQRGTLNVVDKGAFLVLSLPVSAFSGVDENGDGQWSMIEFNAHRADIMDSISGGVRLNGEQGLRPLQGVMLSPVLAENDPAAAVTQLMVLGRFALDENDMASPLHLEMNLFGTDPVAKTLRLTATNKCTDQTQVLVFTPTKPVAELFPSSWQVFLDYMVSGVEHIVTGLDHMLFLLVVLATGWSWRQVVFACSLVHGLGLSSAVTELGLDTQNQLPSLAGFNVGIELGQLAVALAAGTVAVGLLRLRGKNAVATATSIGSFAAVLIGSAWFFQRIVT